MILLSLFLNGAMFEMPVKFGGIDISTVYIIMISEDVKSKSGSEGRLIINRGYSSV